MNLKNIFSLQKIKPLVDISKYATVAVRNSSVWSSDKVIKSPYNSIDISNCTLNEYVWRHLEKWPDRTVSVCSDTGRGYTYEQVFKLSNAFAANLRQKFKIVDGDTVAVLLPNVPDFPIVSMGILEAGGVITTVNPLYTAQEIQRQLLLSEAKLVVTLAEYTKVAKQALEIAKIHLPIVVVNKTGDPIPEGTVNFNELSEDLLVDKSCLKEVRRTSDDVCLLPYSSGTTGLPKGVELTNRNIIANCEHQNEPQIACHNETTPNHQDSVLIVIPMFHIYGTSALMFHKMSLGIKLMTLEKFTPESYFKALEKHKTNLMYTAPPLVLLMGSHPAVTSATLESTEIVVTAAAPLTAADADRFFMKAKRKIEFRQAYGLTECSPGVTFTPKGFSDLSSVGHLVPNTEIRIVDENLQNLGPNEQGEILVRGPQVMLGYKNNPEGNAQAFTEDGWFRTGDVAVVDHNGVITIKDRLKELIKVKGFQVAPAELEAVLREHPAVIDAAVIGVPHPTKGESPKGFVVLNENVNVKSEDIISFVKERVASYKVIEEIQFLQSIPKSSSGKILRRVLKKKPLLKIWE